MILNDHEWLSKVFNDTKRRAVSLRLCESHFLGHSVFESSGRLGTLSLVKKDSKNMCNGYGVFFKFHYRQLAYAQPIIHALLLLPVFPTWIFKNAKEAYVCFQNPKVGQKPKVSETMYSLFKIQSTSYWTVNTVIAIAPCAEVVHLSSVANMLTKKRDFLKKAKQFRAMVFIDDLQEILHGLFKIPITGPLKFKMAEIGYFENRAIAIFLRKKLSDFD